ncbi:MAG TPA: CoA-binding protein [Pseudomonadota bacterium]|nr:CoA-binding protein [Pseudomonadota bacterium]
MTTAEKIAGFLSAPLFAVAGASNDPDKFGYRCFVALRRSGRAVHPLNPRAAEIAGSPAYPALRDVPGQVVALSVVTPPQVTEQIVADAILAGVRYIWMQPGAESRTAIAKAEAAGLVVIAGGPCVLVELAKQGPV